MAMNRTDFISAIVSELKSNHMNEASNSELTVASDNPKLDANGVLRSFNTFSFYKPTEDEARLLILEVTSICKHETQNNDTFILKKELSLTRTLIDNVVHLNTYKSSSVDRLREVYAELAAVFLIMVPKWMLSSHSDIVERVMFDYEIQSKSPNPIDEDEMIERIVKDGSAINHRIEENEIYAECEDPDDFIYEQDDNTMTASNPYVSITNRFISATDRTSKTPQDVQRCILDILQHLNYSTICELPASRWKALSISEEIYDLAKLLRKQSDGAENEATFQKIQNVWHSTICILRDRVIHQPELCLPEDEQISESTVHKIVQLLKEDITKKNEFSNSSSSLSQEESAALLSFNSICSVKEFMAPGVLEFRERNGSYYAKLSKYLYKRVYADLERCLEVILLRASKETSISACHVLNDQLSTIVNILSYIRGISLDKSFPETSPTPLCPPEGIPRILLLAVSSLDIVHFPCITTNILPLLYAIAIQDNNVTVYASRMLPFLEKLRSNMTEISKNIEVRENSGVCCGKLGLSYGEYLCWATVLLACGKLSNVYREIFSEMFEVLCKVLCSESENDSAAEITSWKTKKDGEKRANELMDTCKLLACSRKIIISWGSEEGRLRGAKLLTRLQTLDKALRRVSCSSEYIEELSEGEEIAEKANIRIKRWGEGVTGIKKWLKVLLISPENSKFD